MQLYGSDPDIMAQGARWAVEHGATVVDINMGCPVDKVTKKDGGSKLLTDLPRAARIVERVARELEKCPVSPEEFARRTGPASGSSSTSSPPLREASSPVPIPLTCKVRLCWHTSDYEAGNACSPALARALADAGVCALTVHGRTTEDKFQGAVRLEGIARVVEAVDGRIPVIGNGDVREPEDAERMLRATGCDGVMIGRGALSTPWIFRDAWEYLRTGARPPGPTEAQRVGTILRFFDLMLAQRDERYALFQIRRRISWFAKRLQRPLPDGRLESVKPLKEAIRTAASPAQVRDALGDFLGGKLRGGVEPALPELES